MEHQPLQQSRYRLSRHQIPTHLNVPDKILSFWGIGITVRQLLILLLGWSGVANAWLRLNWLSAYGGAAVTLHIAVTVVPAVIALIVAFKQIAGRSIEVWLLVLLRYWGQPRVCVWRSVRGERAEQAAREKARRDAAPERVGNAAAPQVGRGIESE
jgi:hypothetical protein